MREGELDGAWAEYPEDPEELSQVTVVHGDEARPPASIPVSHSQGIATHKNTLADHWLSLS